MSVPVKPLPPEDLAHVLAHTRELWTEARGRSFFITGGTGFFGMWLLESFALANDALSLGMRAVVLTRDAAAFAKKAPHLAGRADLGFLQGDLRTFKIPAGRFTYLIHAAADTEVWTKGKDSSGVVDEMTAGTRQVLDAAVQLGVAKFLFTSSGAVYGRQPVQLSHVPEDYSGAPDPLAPGSAWSEGKRLAEQICLAHGARTGCAVTIARCFAFVGPHLPLGAQYAMGNFIRDAVRGEPIGVQGDGTPLRSYLYAADLAVWLWTILFRGQPGRIYNVGSDVAAPIAAHARCVSGLAGGKSPVLVARAADPAQPALRYVPAIDRARDELGLAVRIPEAEGIRRTLAWLGSAPAGFASPKESGKLPN